MTRVSIVIPTYNTAAMTGRCVRAVRESMPDAEVIVVDDGSTDGTAELLGRDVLRLDSNRGFAVAANAGVAAATGDLIVLLNSDAFVEKNALAAFVRAFDADPKLGVAGAQLLNEDGTLQWSGGRTPTLLWMLAVVSGAGRFVRRFRPAGAPRVEVDWVSGAAMAFRREVWTACGPLDEDYLFYCQDIDFCLCARAAGWNVRIIPESRVLHGLGATIAANDSLHYDASKLWPDLLTWGGRRYGWAWWFVARMGFAVARAMHGGRSEMQNAERRMEN